MSISAHHAKYLAVLTRCEWWHDDYSLKIVNLPKAPKKMAQQFFCLMHWRTSEDSFFGRERAQRSQKVLDRKTKLKIISPLSFILFRPLCSFAAINPSAIRQDVFFDFIFLGTEVDEQIGKVVAQRHAVFVEYSDWRLLFDTIALLVKVKAGLTKDVAESHDFIGSFISHSLVPL